METRRKMIETKNIESRQDFKKFVEFLQKDLAENPNDWENRSLANFLEAMSRYAQDIEHYYKNTGQNINADAPSWRVFADILCGAKVYE